MSYKYEPVTTVDRSLSFFQNLDIPASQDITNHIFDMAQRSRTISNIHSFSKQAS